MTQTVSVPGVGDLEFPDGMSQPDMAAAIQKNFPQIHPKTDAEKATESAQLSAQGIPTPPSLQPPPPPPPSTTDRLKSAAMTIPHALEAGTRMVGGTLGGLAGGLQGGLEWLDPQMRKAGVNPSTGFDAGAAGANRLIDKVIGPTSDQAESMMRDVANEPAVQALVGLNPVEGALLGSASRAATGAKMAGQDVGRVGSALTKPIASTIEKARGIPATAAAEDLRAGALSTAAESTNRAREAAQRATADAAKAGLDAEHAGAWGAAAQHHVENVQKVGDEIERQMLARPQMKKEELGAMLRAAGETLSKEKKTLRSQAADYEGVMTRDGAKPVSTDGAKQAIKAQLTDSKNPNVEASLAQVAKLVDGPMNLKQANSLRKYLDDAIASKSGNAMTAADQESVRALTAVKKANDVAMETASSDYARANKTFREMSRGDLDHLTGSGTLAKTLEKDSLSGQHKMSEAEVAGHIIGKANTGSDSLSILVNRVPELKDAARMFYTGELYGKGAAPTQAILDNFLKTNARSLRQTGLYDEFKDLASAQRARAETVKGLQGGVTAAKAAETNATQLEKAATSQAAKHQAIADRYSQAQTEIATAPADQVARHVKDLGRKLQDDGLITQDQYARMIRESDAASGGFADAAKRRALLLKIGSIIGLGVAGHETIKRVL